jgi:hypothetical protein
LSGVHVDFQPQVLIFSIVLASWLSSLVQDAQCQALEAGAWELFIKPQVP